jgi:hypothetical protein
MSARRLDLRPPRSVKRIEVIEVRCVIGNGEESPLRELVQFWSDDGTLLAERDEWLAEQPSQ